MKNRSINFLTCGVFVCSVALILLNFISTVFNIIALLGLSAGFFMLAFCLIKMFNEKSDLLKNDQEVIFMERSEIFVGDDGRTYRYMPNENFNKNTSKEIKKTKTKKIIFGTICFTLSAIMLLLFVLQIF